jgi:hypothetical protein
MQACVDNCTVSRVGNTQLAFKAACLGAQALQHLTPECWLVESDRSVHCCDIRKHVQTSAADVACVGAKALQNSEPECWLV